MAANIELEKSCSFYFIENLEIFSRKTKLRLFRIWKLFQWYLDFWAPSFLQKCFSMAFLWRHLQLASDTFQYSLQPDQLSTCVCFNCMFQSPRSNHASANIFIRMINKFNIIISVFVLSSRNISNTFQFCGCCLSPMGFRRIVSNLTRKELQASSVRFSSCIMRANMLGLPMNL